MKCKQARSDIALFVGNDLQEKSAHELEQHVTKCPQCSEHLTSMQETIRVFEQIDAGLDTSRNKSLWPGLSKKIRHIELASSQRDRFNGWVPAVAIVAACILIAVVSDVSTPYAPSRVVSPTAMPASVPPSQNDATRLYSDENNGQDPWFKSFELPVVRDNEPPEKSEPQSGQ